MFQLMILENRKFRTTLLMMTCMKRKFLSTVMSNMILMMELKAAIKATNKN